MVQKNWRLLFSIKNSDQLIKVLKSNDLDLFMWGRGKRGLAFEKVCAEKRVNIDGVCDEKNNDIGKRMSREI